MLEVRLIHRLEPRFNRQATTWRRYVRRGLRHEPELLLAPLEARMAARATDPNELVADLDAPGAPGAPLPNALADEMACVAAWLDKEAGRIRLVHTDRGLASAYPALPTYRAASSVRSPR